MKIIPRWRQISQQFSARLVRGSLHRSQGFAISGNQPITGSTRLITSTDRSTGPSSIDGADGRSSDGQELQRGHAGSLQALGEGASVDVTVVSLQDNGLASYALGQLQYSRVGPFRVEELSTRGGRPLLHLFSNRLFRVGEPPPPGPILDDRPQQPFSILNADQLGLSFRQQFFVRGQPVDPNPVAEFTLLSHANTTITVSTQPMGDLLIGSGPSVGDPVFLFAFTKVFGPEGPPR